MLDKLIKEFLYYFHRRKLQLVYDKKFLANVKSLQSLINCKIYNQQLYLKALTHRSYLELHPELKKSNERLEFFGDSVLNMVVAKFLLKKFPKEGEGFLTKTRSAIVNRYHLYGVAENIQLQNLILYNEKYLRGFQDGFQTIMADTVEALIGAIYLDSGLKKAEKFVHKYVIKSFKDDKFFLVDTNYKGQLLEYAHANKMSQPTYKVVSEEGPNHNKKFVIHVLLDGKVAGIGEGKNKKIAEQEASKNALKNFKS